MKKYEPQKIEKKWQKYWEKNKVFKTNEASGKSKYYILDMFPYPSGAGLHVGHPKGYIATDIVARTKTMQGFNVLHPMGWDAFGLPAENYAIQNKVHPSVATQKNVVTFKKQLGLLGFTYDWDREVNTTDPKYYHWTQWMFLQMYKKGLVFESNEPVNWCPTCKTVLANEDLEDDKCERCGTVVEQKPLRQWVIRITDYAERLLNDIDKLKEWPEPIKEMQRNWIGKSEGALVKFTVIPSVAEESISLEVFTTRPDTLFGATYCVIAPEHALLKNQKLVIKNQKEVLEYIEAAKNKTILERTELQKDKTGVELKGIKAVNPANGDELPVFVGDYVLGGYGTGAIMAVPAHDERDHAFAKKYRLPIHEVVLPVDKNGDVVFDGEIEHEAFTEPGVCTNSDFLNNLPTAQAKQKMIAWLEKNNLGKRQVQYKLRDWVFSRQRYWGEPIPLIHCENCQNKKYNYIIVHGFGGSSKWGFKTWLKNELEKDGHKVYNPDLPNADKPNVDEQAQYILDNAPFEIDENTILVGHSLGSTVIYSLLEKINKQVYKSVLVDPVYKPDFADTVRPIVAASSNWEFDWKKIKNNCLEFTILGDKKHQIIKAEHLEELRVKLDANLFLVTPSETHFSNHKAEVVTQEPEVLKACINNGWVPVPDNDLPLELPKVKSYEPSGTGESPLATIDKWVNTKCPRCGGKAKRETNTMPQWAGSCWYYLRYCDPHNDNNLFVSTVGLRSSIVATPKDELYFSEFKNIYSALEQQGIKVWAGNRLMLNGINRELWVPLRTVSLMAYNDDVAKIKDFLVKYNYKETENNAGNLLFEKGDLRVEIVPVYRQNGEIFSLTFDNIKQSMLPTDLPTDEIGNLWNFSYRVVSPRYGLEHYKFIQNNKNEDRSGLGDEEKIKFLNEWLEKVNKKILYWNPVDFYVGGAEHATRHLIYARFWHKFLFDIGVVHNEEPFTRLKNVGLILAEDGRKMSKRWGNVINPDDIVNEFGADAMRIYEMFMGPFDQPCAWNTQGLIGARRFLDKVWGLQDKINNKFSNNDKKLAIVLHQTIKKVSEDIPEMRFNTAIAQMMILANELSQRPEISTEFYSLFVKILSPFAPHMCEELWNKLGNKESIVTASWPKYDPTLIQDDEITLAVQVNGKLRDTITVPADITEDGAKQIVLASEKVQKWLEGKTPKKVIYVKGKLVSIVV